MNLHLYIYDLVPAAAPVGGKGTVVQELVPVVGRRRQRVVVVVGHVAALAVVLLLKLLSGRDRHALRLGRKLDK